MKCSIKANIYDSSEFSLIGNELGYRIDKLHALPQIQQRTDSLLLLALRWLTGFTADHRLRVDPAWGKSGPLVVRSGAMPPTMSEALHHTKGASHVVYYLDHGAVCHGR